MHRDHCRMPRRERLMQRAAHLAARSSFAIMAMLLVLAGVMADLAPGCAGPPTRGAPPGHTGAPGRAASIDRLDGERIVRAPATTPDLLLACATAADPPGLTPSGEDDSSPDFSAEDGLPSSTHFAIHVLPLRGWTLLHGGHATPQFIARPLTAPPRPA